MLKGREKSKISEKVVSKFLSIIFFFFIIISSGNIKTPLRSIFFFKISYDFISVINVSILADLIISIILSLLLFIFIGVYGTVEKNEPRIPQYDENVL